MNAFPVATTIIVLMAICYLGVHGSESIQSSKRRCRKKAGGAIYTRWGHDECPKGSAQLVYSGWVGGSSYRDPGAAAEYICLSQKPTESTDKRNHLRTAHLYGAEYSILGTRDSGVPCAVCQSYARLNSFMLPGSDVCPDCWSLEYKGDLMAGYYNNIAASQYVCVDSERKTLKKGFQEIVGKLFHPVKPICGGLDCPPYDSTKIVTCAVCSK